MKPTMNLLLDFGNTRLKWALTDASRQLVQRGVVDYALPALDAWSHQLAATDVQRILYASVVSAEQEASVLTRLRAPSERFSVSPRAGGLHNGYGTPDTLGVDRWASAMGAWAMVGQSCLVIGAGTATTIDLIECDMHGGVYRGGLILPGIDLMLQSLHQRTARLPEARVNYRALPGVPDNTHDAMTSGAVEATCGAIERMGRRLPDTAPWLLTGGNAPILQAALGQRVRPVDDLVLAGLAQAF